MSSRPPAPQKKNRKRPPFQRGPQPHPRPSTASGTQRPQPLQNFQPRFIRPPPPPLLQHPQFAAPPPSAPITAPLPIPPPYTWPTSPRLLTIEADCTDYAVYVIW
jgi:hypothetical protein